MNNIKPNTDNPFFSQNGRICVPPFKVDRIAEGSDFLAISFYKIANLYTYSVQAQIRNRIFAKFPHPQDGLFSTVQECKNSAKKDLKNWTDQNRLKKCFRRMVPVITDQLDLFEDL